MCLFSLIVDVNGVCVYVTDYACIEIKKNVLIILVGSGSLWVEFSRVVSGDTIRPGCCWSDDYVVADMDE